MSSPSRCSFAIAFAVASFASQATEPQSQRLYPEGSQQTFSGPATYFTGQVDVQMLFPSQDAAPYSGAYVTFAPGARTAWHQHPAGQHMIVTKGTAITVTRPGQVIAFHEGEAVWCPEGVDHWHGSMPDSSMTHLVITGSREGQNVVWKEQVFDFAPGINTFLQKHLFGDVFARGVLDHQDREVLTVAMLSVSPETEPQLRAHIGMALNTGLKRDQLQELSTLVQYSVGPAAGQRIDSAIKAALKS